MKLLIITQKVDINDDNLGFFHRWLEKFSEKANKLYVVCNSRGRYDLPSNAIIYSLGKEKGYSKLRKFFRLQKFLLKHLFSIDGIFVHMGPIYAMAVLPLAWISRKKIILWYAHKKISFLAKIASLMVFKIFTPSKDSFIHKGKKNVVTGHGIDIDSFKPGIKKATSGKKTILTTGRIAPVKDLETLVRATDLLVNQKLLKNIQVKIVGSALEHYEKEYFNFLHNLIQEKNLGNYIEFLKGVPNRELVSFYLRADIFVNMQGGGGAGKAVLEAMACGTPVVLCTRTFNELLGEFRNEVIFEEKNPQDFAQKILNCLNFSENKLKDYSNLLRKIVAENHNLDNLINQVILALSHGQ